MMRHSKEHRRRPLLALGALVTLAALEVEAPKAGLASITEERIHEHVAFLADPALEGRDTPSEGQERVAARVAALFAEWGMQPAADSLEVMKRFGGNGPDHAATEGTFYRPFLHEYVAPRADRCTLLLLPERGDEVLFELGTDFVPIDRASGGVRGDLVFAGFGITDKSEHYDDYKGLQVRGSVVLFFEGEPRNPRKFEGEEVTEGASLWVKLQLAERLGAAGALVVRRHPEGATLTEDNHLDFRHSWASWLDRRGGRERTPRRALPALEISMECATELLGTDAEALARKMDRSGRPSRVRIKGLEVSFDSTTEEREVRLDNLVAVLPGRDAALREEYVVIGAHYDHIGVGPRGRVGCGADDNASGVAAVLEVAEALVLEPPRRSVLVCLFTGEEDGLFGSHDLAAHPPVPKERIVAMLNADQIGRGDARAVAVLGTKQNPELERVLSRARRLGGSGVDTVITGKSEDLFARSDHYSFHREGVPTLFFFEAASVDDNDDYHTWRDTTDRVDLEKVTNTARLILETAWILANDDERPPSPRG